jgi:hypothetical protein
VISYSSRQLRRHEEYYPTHDLKVAAVVLAFVNVATLSPWKCGSHLYRSQKLEVCIHSTGSEYEAAKMTRVDQGL